MSEKLELPSRSPIIELDLSKKLPKKAEALLVPIFKGEDGPELAASGLFSDDVEIAVLRQLIAVGATGAHAELTRIPGTAETEVDFLIAVGLGDTEELDEEKLRRAAGAAGRSLKGLKSVATTLGTFGLKAAVEGIVLGAYAYPGIRREEDDPAKLPVKKVTFIGDPKADKSEFVAAQITAESVILARDLVNTPSSHLYPESYAAIIAAEAEQFGVEVEILDEKALQKQGFGGILAVGKGSDRGPRLVRLSWSPRKAKTSVALVGKGITFDTGGISLKPAAKMEDMISDMGGSAAMVATILAAARMNLNLSITATLPLAENMPSGSATRPGDVITHYGGLTSEIINTDAEGRIVLADALARASEDEPDYLIEAATLTGAQMVALGAKTSGVMGSEEFRDRVAETGRKAGEPAWAMPLLEEQEEELKSPVADIRNSHNSRNAGMLFAGLYLSRFIGEDIQWAHVDIAGPSFNNGKDSGYTPKRATGVPVRTFVTLLQELAAEA